MSALARDDFASRAAALAARAEAPRPEAWRPEKGHPHVLVGELVEWQRRPSGYNPDKIVDVAILRDVDGQEWAVWAHGKVLEGEFAELRARAGEALGLLVAIHYEGKVERQGRDAYTGYRVVVDARPLTSAPGAEQASPDTTADTRVSAAPAPRCEQCGYADPEHAAGCPNEDPF